MHKHPELLFLGQQIRTLRKSKGFSQEGFACAAEMDRSYYGAIERGENNVAALNLIKIAKTLGVEVGDLFQPIKEYKINK